jgi:hypothetical protein
MTELLTLISSSELIQATKCAARNAPASVIHIRLLLERLLRLCGPARYTNPLRSAENTRRYVAMTNADA